MKNTLPKLKYISKRKMYFYLTAEIGRSCTRAIPAYRRWFRRVIPIIIRYQDNQEWWWYPTDAKYYTPLAEFYVGRPSEILILVRKLEKEFTGAFKDIDRRSESKKLLSDAHLRREFARLLGLLRLNFQMISVARRLDMTLAPHLTADVATLVHSPFQSYLQHERTLFWRGVARCKTSAARERFLQRHLRRFAWVTRSYYDEPPLMMDDLLQRLKRAPDRLLERDALGRCPKEMGNVVRCLSLAAYLKDYLRGINARIIHEFEFLFVEISRRHSVPIPELKGYTGDEILLLLRRRICIARTTLASRRRLTIFLGDRLITGTEAQRVEEQLVRERETGQTEWQGRKVSAGKATGPALVARTVSDMRAICSPVILIVPNTNPAFVPYLSNVKAIIAEEGGLTTHAALIARELGIPAVLGIEYATKIFKDGDLVEVDAEKGIVRKL